VTNLGLLLTNLGLLLTNLGLLLTNLGRRSKWPLLAPLMPLAAAESLQCKRARHRFRW
jgi:hypothetical protein